MKATPDLFNLVKSLSKYEKRYVTLFLSSGLYKNNKNSLLLFRAVSRQEHFDDDVLKKQMGKVFSKRLSAEKNKLFDLVLESMIFLYRDSMPERRVVGNRLRSWFFFQKGLRPLGWKYFHKARKTAEEYEFFPQLIMLAYQENYETRKAAAQDNLFSEEKYHTRDRKILEALNEDLVLHTLFTELIDLQKNYGHEMKSVETHLDRIMKHPLMDSSRKLHAFSARMSRLDSRALYSSMKNNHREAYQCFGEMVAEIEKSKVHIDQNYVRYCNALSNQLMHAVLMREYDHVPDLVQKTKKAIQGILNYFPYDTAFNEFIGVHLFELISWKNRADTNKGPVILARLEKDFLHYRKEIRDVLAAGILFLFGSYHYYLGNLKKALQYFNDFVDSTDSESAQNFQCMARLVKLLLHYDLGHYDLLPSLTQSTTRLLRKKDQLGPFEKELLAFFRNSKDKQNKSALEKLLSVTRKLAPGYYSYGAWCDFEFEAWIESHLKNQSFAQVISAK
ncbi:MAG TPA: hypothetical protein VFJ43_03570 [Bacteroidia bacterium]|nr:hypothetical protein [Bacteroidia bacterium]